MATDALISWNAPEHLHTEKNRDWFWSVGLITIALVIVCLIFAQYIPAIFVLVAAFALTLHASHPPRTVYFEVNDRGIISDKILYPFLTLDSFWIPHDHFPPKIILKSHKLLSPYIIMYIDEVDPEEVREILLRYIAEKEHHEHLFKLILERLGF